MTFKIIVFFSQMYCDINLLRYWTTRFDFKNKCSKVWVIYIMSVSLLNSFSILLLWSLSMIKPQMLLLWHLFQWTAVTLLESWFTQFINVLVSEITLWQQHEQGKMGAYSCAQQGCDLGLRWGCWVWLSVAKLWKLRERKKLRRKRRMMAKDDFYELDTKEEKDGRQMTLLGWELLG